MRIWRRRPLRRRPLPRLRGRLKSPVSTRQPIQKKSIPQLVQESRRFSEKLLDLAWLLKMTAKAAPLETALFVAAALASGLTVPIELWATKHLVDTLALRAEEAAGGAPGVWLWFGILAGALIVNRIVSALEPLYRIKMREVAGHNLEAAAMRRRVGWS